MLIEVTVCDRPPAYVHSYRQRRIITPTENPDETLVIAIFQERFTSWVEKISCSDYPSRHNATSLRSIDVPEEIIRNAWKMVCLKMQIEEIKEAHQIDIYEVFAS
jgi:hypothetical protein